MKISRNSIVWALILAAVISGGLFYYGKLPTKSDVRITINGKKSCADLSMLFLKPKQRILSAVEAPYDTIRLTKRLCDGSVYELPKCHGKQGLLITKSNKIIGSMGYYKRKKGRGERYEVKIDQNRKEIKLCVAGIEIKECSTYSMNTKERR